MKAKRCKSRSPLHNRRCQKARGHERREIVAVCQNGALTWPTMVVEVATYNSAGAFVGFEPAGAAAAPTDFIAPLEMNDIEAELRGWWFDQAEAEVDGTVKKAIEYSSTDLLDLGRTLAYIAGREVTDEEAEELGVFFYLSGKMSRWAGAIKAGRRVSDDTLFDISVYTRMAQRIRHAGNWPGVNQEQTIKQQAYGMEQQ